MLKKYDVAIIGAGVCGSLIAHKMSKYNLSLCIIDKETEPSEGASKANSGIVHAGYDAEENTLKSKLNIEGNAMMEAICKELRVEFKKCGSLVISFSEEETKVLKILLERGEKCGVKGLSLLSKDELLKKEPNLSDNVKAALFAETAGVISPYELTVAALETAVLNGLDYLRYTSVLSVQGNTIYTDKGTIESCVIINAAGVYADEIAGGDFKITPRKGEYFLFDKKLGNKVRSVIFTVPTKEGKGILVSPTVHGNLLVGPTSQAVQSKVNTETTAENSKILQGSAKKILKEFNLKGLITGFTGIRASGNTGDFIIDFSKTNENLINVGGIESPGLSASPAIAEMVFRLFSEKGFKPVKKENYKRRADVIRVNELPLEKRNELIKKNKAYGKIICRCESISEGEIVDAIKRPAGAKTVDGVKRRVRAGMGRCQGGFCLPSVIDILARELNVSPFEVSKKGGNSTYYTGRNNKGKSE